MRTKLLAGNWKMHFLNSELPEFFRSFGELIRGASVDKCDVMFAAPYTLLQRAVELATPYGIRIAAQNFHHEMRGAFTGEVSIGMLKELGVQASLVGHSERRQLFGETDASVGRKAKAALDQGVSAIVCVGETLGEREGGTTEDVVAHQMLALFDAVPTAPAASSGVELVIAYEPVWAIGTGRSATSQQAQDVHRFIRRLLAERYGDAAAASLRILYGGSASPANIEELLAQADIDGALIGGASLKPADFAKMVQSVR